MNALATTIQKIMSTREGRALATAAGVHLYEQTSPSEFEAIVYEPIVCLIIQGKKETTVGERVFQIAAGQCVVVSHDVPVLARITEASPARPYLALVLRLDVAVLRSLYDEVGELAEESDAACCLEVAPLDVETLDVIRRYVALVDDPVGARVLLPLVRKELHFRLYRSRSGASLRALLRRDSHASHVARAVNALRRSFRDRVVIVELAKSVGMSTSSFHKHFKAITMSTPLQYQKNLRLTEARRLLRAGRHSVSAAAFEVGYESASQFSREYGRRFNCPPSADLVDAKAQSRAQP